jgi:ATP-dependent DNA helicase RecQ
MRTYCTVPVCRHKSLSEYFGQPYAGPDCGACDVCLHDVQADSEATELAQKILSCVARVEQRFGVTHVVKVLRGANDKFVRHQRHDRLSTFGLLKELDPKALTNLVYQLVEEGVLDRTPGDRPVLRLEKSEGDGVDGALFESLRGLRREIAGERGVPAFVIFGDAALRDMARLRPVTLAQFLQVHGVGARKLKEFGPGFVAHIATFLRINPTEKASRPTAGAATAPDDGSAPTPRGAHPTRRGKSSPT